MVVEKDFGRHLMVVEKGFGRHLLDVLLVALMELGLSVADIWECDQR
jgi:hypothetical protein